MAVETPKIKTLSYFYCYQAPNMEIRDINHLSHYLSPSQCLDGKILATDCFALLNKRLLGDETAVDIGARRSYMLQYFLGHPDYMAEVWSGLPRNPDH